MLWEMGFSLPLAQKSKIQKIRKSKMRTFFDFSMPVSSRYKTQKNNISGLGFYASGKHEFSNPGTNSEKPIFRFPTQSEFYYPMHQSFWVFEETERAKHQSIGDPRQGNFCWLLCAYFYLICVDLNINQDGTSRMSLGLAPKIVTLLAS